MDAEHKAAIQRYLHLIQRTIMFEWPATIPAWRIDMAKAEKVREQTRKENDAKERGEFLDVDALKKKALAEEEEAHKEIVDLAAFKQNKVPANKIINAELVTESLEADYERLMLAAKKCRQRKKLLADVAALFEAAFEKDITRRSTLEIIQADIERLEKKLKIGEIQEAEEEIKVEDKRMKYAEPINPKVSFEQELSAIKKKEREEASKWMEKFQRNTIILAHYKEP